MSIPKKKILKPQRVVVNPVTAAQSPAVNTPAVATLASGAKLIWQVSYVRWSYDGAPTAGKLTIAWTDVDGTSRTEVYGITAGGPGFLPLDLTMPAVVAPTFTLAAAGAAVKGTVYVTAVKRGK